MRQNVRMRLQGGRTAKRAIVCEGLELTGLMKPFDLEVWYGERVAVLGSNGSGKSHFLRLLAEGLLKSAFALTEARVLYELAQRDEATAVLPPASSKTAHPIKSATKYCPAGKITRCSNGSNTSSPRNFSASLIEVTPAK